MLPAPAPFLKDKPRIFISMIIKCHSSDNGEDNQQWSMNKLSDKCYQALRI